MSVRITLQGREELQRALARMGDDVREAVEDAVFDTAIELQRDIVRSVQRGPASGRTYRKYNPNRTHTASAPGQPPMSDTGRLAGSIDMSRTGPLTVTVGSDVVYAQWLEYGTINMAPRPFFRPAVERIRDDFDAALERALTGAMR